MRVLYHMGVFSDEFIQNVMLFLFLSFILLLYLSVEKKDLVQLPLVLVISLYAYRGDVIEKLKINQKSVFKDN